MLLYAHRQNISDVPTDGQINLQSNFAIEILHKKYNIYIVAALRHPVI